MRDELRVLFPVLTYLQIVFEELLDHVMHHFINRLDVMVTHTLVSRLFSSVFVSFGVQFVSLFASLANSCLALGAVLHNIIGVQFIVWPPASTLRVLLLLMWPAPE